MTPVADALEAAVKDLADALDETIRLQEETLTCLEAGTRAVVRRDVAALEAGLEALGSLVDRIRGAEAHQRAARTRLAEALGRPGAEATLGRLERDLPPALARRLAGRRARLRDLVPAVRRAHLRMALLVGEVSRLNRALLAAFVPEPSVPQTYRTDGKPEFRPADSRAWSGGGAVLDARL